MHALMKPLLALAFCGFSIAGCGGASDDDPAGSSSNAEPARSRSNEPMQEPIVHSLAPLPGMEDSVPVITHSQTVRLYTTAGEVVIDVYPEAAPNAAQRFVELVQDGYYDLTPVFRIVPDYIAQFGINWREPHRQWRNDTFNDDPPLFALDRGTLAFAKAGFDTASTQVFINHKQNNHLAAPTERYNFAVFGKVVEGMDVVDSFLVVGESPMELDQRRLWSSGESFLESLDMQPTMIERAVLE